MFIDLTRLYNNKRIYIDENVSITGDLKSLGIDDLRSLHVKGYVSYTLTDAINLDLVFSGTIIMKDAITLEEIEHNFSIPLNDSYEENDGYLENYIDKSKNILDIREILWQNIVLEVPIRARKNNEDVSLSGEGWQLNKNTKDEIDPRFIALKELLEDRKEWNYGSSF